jgi:hypothetical protein
MDHPAIEEAQKHLGRMKDVLALDLSEPCNAEQAAEFRRWRADLAAKVIDLGKWIEQERPHFSR